MFLFRIGYVLTKFTSVVDNFVTDIIVYIYFFMQINNFVILFNVFHAQFHINSVIKNQR